MTKASILHLIDRLQFPWLTASIAVMLHSLVFNFLELVAVNSMFKNLLLFSSEMMQGGVSEKVEGVCTETITVPSKMVGLIIGRGGEQITR